MMRFVSIGNADLLSHLVSELRALGAEANDDNPTLVLIGASSIAEAEEQLKTLSSTDAAKAVVIGLDASLQMHVLPKPGSLAAFLEGTQILGSMPMELTMNWGNFGFAGKKELADKMRLWYGGPAQSRTYAIWAGLEEFESAGAFLLRLSSMPGA